MDDGIEEVEVLESKSTAESSRPSAPPKLAKEKRQASWVEGVDSGENQEEEVQRPANPMATQQNNPHNAFSVCLNAAILPPSENVLL